MIDLELPEDLSRMVFFSDSEVPPRQIAADSGELNARNMKAPLTRIGQTHREALFSIKPLLIEGPSDEIICNALDSRLDIYLGAAGSHLIPVDGTGQMTAMSKLMRAIGKPPVVLADIDGLADNLDLVKIFYQTAAREKAVSHGHANIATFAKTIHDDFSTMVSNNWADLAPKASRHAYWTDPASDQFVAKRRAALATLLNMSQRETRSISNGHSWNDLRIRFLILIECLEAAGCFFLRNGTIEDYYTLS